MAITGAVVFVFWLPVAVQQLTKDPGNVSQLVDFFGDHGREQRYEDAWHVLALQLGAWPDWLKGASPPSVIGTIDFSAALPVPIGLLALLGATALAWRRARHAFVLDVVVLAVLAASFVAMTRIVGDVLTYLVKWTWALGTITWIAVSWSCVAAWQARERPGTVRSPRSQQIARVGMAALVVVFATVVVVDTVAAARAGTPEPEASASMAKLGDAAFAALPDRPGVVEVHVRGREGADTGRVPVSPTSSSTTAKTCGSGPSSSSRTGHTASSATTRYERSCSSPTRKGWRARALPGYRSAASDGGVTVFVGPP